VGAGLPVIATLQHLVHTGDRIVKVNPLPLRDCNCLNVLQFDYCDDNQDFFRLHISAEFSAEGRLGIFSRVQARAEMSKPSFHDAEQFPLTCSLPSPPPCTFINSPNTRAQTRSNNTEQGSPSVQCAGGGHVQRHDNPSAL